MVDFTLLANCTASSPSCAHRKCVRAQSITSTSCHKKLQLFYTLQLELSPPVSLEADTRRCRLWPSSSSSAADSSPCYICCCSRMHLQIEGHTIYNTHRHCMRVIVGQYTNTHTMKITATWNQSTVLCCWFIFFFSSQQEFWKWPVILQFTF